MTPSEEWDRSAPWVYETAAPDWVSELARELPNRRRARGIELDPDDQYYPSEDDFDDEPPSADDWYTPHDAPLRHPGRAGIRSVPDEPPSRSRRNAGDDDPALPDWADGAAFSARADEAARSAGAGRYRPSSPHAFTADELAPRRRRRAAPEPDAYDPDGRSWRLDDHPPVGRAPVDAAPVDPLVDDLLDGDDPVDGVPGGAGGIGGSGRPDPYRRRPDGTAGWSTPAAEREQRMASHPSQYVDRPATGRARVPQPRPDAHRAENPWTAAAALPPVHRHDEVLDELRSGRDAPLPRDARLADDELPAPRNPWVLDAGAPLSPRSAGGRYPDGAAPDDDGDGPDRGRRDRADAGGDAADRRWSADSPLPSGTGSDGRVSPTARPASGPARPTPAGSGADPAAPRVISTAAAPVTPRVISRSTPPAVPRVVSRSTPPATPRVISAGPPTTAPKTVTPALKPPATTAPGTPPPAVPRSLSEPAVSPPGVTPIRPAPPSSGAEPRFTTPDGAPDGSVAGATRQSWAYPASDGNQRTVGPAESGDAQIIPLRRRAPRDDDGRPEDVGPAPETGGPRPSGVLPAGLQTRPGATAPDGSRAVGTAAVPAPEAGYGPRTQDTATPPDVTAAPHRPGEPGTSAVPDVPGRAAATPTAPGPATAPGPVAATAVRAGEPAVDGPWSVNDTGDALRDTIAPGDLLPTALMPGPDPTQERPAPEAAPVPTPATEPSPTEAEPAAGPAEPPDEVALAAIRWRLDGATLREVVDDRDELRELGLRLDRPLSASDDNVSRARLLCLRAEVYRLLDELGMAAAASRLALAHAEAAADAYSVVVAQGELAHVLRLRGDYAEADRLFEQAACAEVPELLRCVIHENAGRCCFDQGRYMEALDHFTRAIRLGDPLDLELVERIDVALEAVYIRVLRDGWGPYPRLRREIMAAVPGPDRHPAPRAGTAPRPAPAARTAPVTAATDPAAGPPPSSPAQHADAARPSGTEQDGGAAASPDADTEPIASDADAPPPVRVPTQTQRTADPPPAPAAAAPVAAAPVAATPVATPPAPAAVAPQAPTEAAPARQDVAAPGSWFVSRS